MSKENDARDDQPTPWGHPFQTLLDHFKSSGIRYGCQREERRAWFTMDSGTALQKCSFRFDSTGDFLQMLIRYPVLVREKFRPLASEFLTRANVGQVHGNFEMHMNDGEVRFRVSHLMHEGQIDEVTICRLFGTAMMTADRYFPAFMNVLFAGVLPEDAVFLAELDHHAKKAEGAKKSLENPKAAIRAPQKTRKPEPQTNAPASDHTPEPGESHPLTPSDQIPSPIPAPGERKSDDESHGGGTRKAA